MREDPTSTRPSSGSSRLRPIDLLIVGLGVLLFADAAIETWPHAAMRRWVIGFALVYVVVAALSLVRRVSSTTQSVLALAMLLLLIAATAWFLRWARRTPSDEESLGAQAAKALDPLAKTADQAFGNAQTCPVSCTSH